MLDANSLRKIILRSNPQNSIEELDPDQLAQHVTAMPQGAGKVFEDFFQGVLPGTGGPHDEEPSAEDEHSYVPSTGDRRRKIIAAIRQRQGQSKFRKNLIRRYGAKCVITSCIIMEIVEAAHIWPYRGEEDNHPENGLLLRADMHTLYDLNLLGIDPDLRVHLASEVREPDYTRYHGQSLGRMKSPPSREAIKRRWDDFTGRHLTTTTFEPQIKFRRKD